jgi:hypothetical protein
MTEVEWNSCLNVRTMFDWIVPNLDRRKLILSCVGCCRRFGAALSHPTAAALLETAEQFADGLTSAEAVREAVARADEAHSRDSPLMGRGHPHRPSLIALTLLRAVIGPDPGVTGVPLTRQRHRTASMALREVINQLGHLHQKGRTFGAFGDARAREKERLADLFRDVTGNPFRQPHLEPAWFAWRDGIIRRLAQATYEDRLPSGFFDPVRLAVLADALEEAGCTDGVLLGHLRRSADHVRGCWAIDLSRSQPDASLNHGCCL